MDSGGPGKFVEVFDEEVSAPITVPDNLVVADEDPFKLPLEELPEVSITTPLASQEHKQPILSDVTLVTRNCYALSSLASSPV